MPRTLWIGSASACVLAVAVAAQLNFGGVSIKATHVAGAVHMLEGEGGNIGVSAGEDGLVIIDDQYAALAPKIRETLQGIHPGRLAFVLNTHFHSDHTSGNAEFGRDAPIIAHTNTRKRLTERNTVLGRETAPMVKHGLPVITFDESLTLHVNGEEIQATHFPHAHTDGDVAIYFTKSNVLHTGDLFSNGRFPFVDLDHGGDVEGMLYAVDQLLETAPPDVWIIPGHGPLATVDDLRTYRRMLSTSMELARAAHASGKTMDEFKAAGLPAEWRSWGREFIRTDTWLDIVYRSTKKP